MCAVGRPVRSGQREHADGRLPRRPQAQIVDDLVRGGSQERRGRRGLRRGHAQVLPRRAGREYTAAFTIGVGSNARRAAESADAKRPTTVVAIQSLHRLIGAKLPTPAQSRSDRTCTSMNGLQDGPGSATGILSSWIQAAARPLQPVGASRRIASRGCFLAGSPDSLTEAQGGQWRARMTYQISR